jgi:hypothetical protein
MAHRRIGQEGFRFGARAERQTSLDELGALIDWPLAAQVLSSLYPAAKGEKAWPPLAMFKAPCLPLGMVFPMSRWPGRSVTGQASGAFAALPATRRRPSAPPAWRFRRQLVAPGLDAASLPRSHAILRLRARPCARAPLRNRLPRLLHSSTPPSSARRARAIRRPPRAPHAHARAWLQGPHCGRQGQRHHPRHRDDPGQ